MAEIIGAVTGVTKSFLEINKISIDNWGFKLFYKWSTTLLVFCSVIVTARQFFGDPIKCDAGKDRAGVEQGVLDTYCWMYSTFDIPPKYKGPCAGTSTDDTIGSIVYNSYYQWVPIYLIFLAVLFYLPRGIWLYYEGGLMSFFGKGTTTRQVEDQEEKLESLLKFFSENIKNKYNVYFCGFIICEILNLFIVVLQFFLTNRFLHHRYMTYGWSVWQYYLLPREEQEMPGVINPMCYTFPRIASCKYHRWGTGGDQENFGALCILALNIINDKVFLVLWLWFFILSVIGFIRLIYRILQCFSAGLRYQLINMRMYRYFNRSMKSDKIEMYLKQSCKLGDWFVLYQLSKNMNKPFFMEFLSKLPDAINFRGCVYEATGVRPYQDEKEKKDKGPLIDDKKEKKEEKEEDGDSQLKIYESVISSEKEDTKSSKESEKKKEHDIDLEDVHFVASSRQSVKSSRMNRMRR